MRSGKVFLGVFAGVAAGVLLGVLFAPDKGWNTRMRISKKGEDLAEDLKEKFAEFIDSLRVKSDEVNKEASDFSEQSWARSDGAKKKVKTATA